MGGWELEHRRAHFDSHSHLAEKPSPDERLDFSVQQQSGRTAHWLAWGEVLS